MCEQVSVYLYNVALIDSSEHLIWQKIWSAEWCHQNHWYPTYWQKWSDCLFYFLYLL